MVSQSPPSITVPESPERSEQLLHLRSLRCPSPLLRGPAFAPSLDIGAHEAQVVQDGGSIGLHHSKTPIAAEHLGEEPFGDRWRRHMHVLVVEVRANLGESAHQLVALSAALAKGAENEATDSILLPQRAQDRSNGKPLGPRSFRRRDSPGRVRGSCVTGQDT